MSRKYVSCTIEDRIAVVTIDNPPMNALSDAAREELDEVFEELDENIENAMAVILTGAGEKAFVAGADIKVFPTLNPEIARRRLKRGKALLLKIENFDRPVICAINGFCLGLGLELAMCCDIRIAAEHAKLGQPEINVGVIPGAGGTQRLARLVGEGIAKELIYTGRFIDAQEAQRIGLVNKVVPGNELRREAMEMAEGIAGKPPLAVRAAKEAIHQGLSMALDQGLEIEIDRWSYLCGTEDQKEGAAAFIEKRKPVFKGR
ncbi:MAG: enoyl-CoA hydratase/isomerase family protein [Deltaproteobacteria bacterium]|nr:enoyl-CoA hydratase/isomerase family protein [Deltaproteobacteria bacterium]MBW2120218.1 enoyl-CoA hydratase/isomerase family protein [Deltaproteobacteria bacterium]